MLGAYTRGWVWHTGARRGAGDGEKESNGTEKRQWCSILLLGTRAEAEPAPGQAASEGTLAAPSSTAPPLAEPGQLMILINNPDPEISDRSCNLSPEAALQPQFHSIQGARLTGSFHGSSPWLQDGGSKAAPRSSGVSHSTGMFHSNC